VSGEQKGGKRNGGVGEGRLGAEGGGREDTEGRGWLKRTRRCGGEGWGGHRKLKKRAL